MHDHPVSVAKTYDVNWTAALSVVRLVDGGQPRLIPEIGTPPRLTGMRLTYVEADLEQTARAAYESIRHGPRGDRGVIELAGEYIDGLRTIVYDGERDRGFDS